MARSEADERFSVEAREAVIRRIHNVQASCASHYIAGTRPSWDFLGLVGLIGGGSTFLVTVLGFSFPFDAIFMLFLTLAAGSISYVMSELLHVVGRFARREVAMWDVLLGFMS